ncbi:MAG: hypothetical protein ACR2J3_01330 [Aridibacter sp.]
MTSEQTEKLIFILREAKQIVNRSISDLCELGEQALYVLSENEKVPDAHAFTHQKHLDNKKQLSERLGICERLISELMKEGLPFIRCGKERTQFEYDEVVKWMKTRNIETKESQTKLRVVK